MIRVLGGPKRLCDGLTRRDLLQVSSLGLLGLGLPQTGSSSQARGDTPAEKAPGEALPGFGQAKSCIFLFMYGASSQIETFDPKPDAPVEVRGELGCIESSLPGLNVCEGLPHLARVMDKVSVIRSVSHPYPVHGVAYATTGNPNVTLPMELNPRDPNHWPYIGSVVDYVDQMGRTKGSTIPRNLALPWAFSSRRVGEVARAGPYGGFLGPSYDPIYTAFVGKGAKKAEKTLGAMVWDDFEPYRGVTPESRFQLGAVSNVGPDLTIDRLDRRRSLLEQIENLRKETGAASGSAGIDHQRAMAYNLLGSESLRRAFDIGEEAPSTRGMYGMTLFGQAALTARRLVEVGGRFVSVFWDEYGLAGSGWDTHTDHYPRMKDELLPGLDLTLSGLLIDLDRRGQLDETLVVLLSEHGRTPKITPVQGGGRNHWSRCYSVVMAGGGIARGRVLGKSDKIAGDPVERRVSPKEILATIYHLLGIDPNTMLNDRQNRPIPLVQDAEVIAEVLA